MILNLREMAEDDLSVTLEGHWGLPVELIDPDGNEQTFSANSPDIDDPLPLMGQVLYSSYDSDPETGAPLLIDNHVITLRLTSLDRIPKAGERWGIRYPETPSTTAELVTRFLSADKAPFLNESIGIIKLYPQKADQV